ncbi:MAG: CDP-alcohol phosphatidyltransferase family protein [Pseudomonadota bacterium]
MGKLADLLSYYRIAAAPVAAAMALIGHRDAFFVLIIVSLATDLIDGPLARLSGAVSKRGAKLDTIGDAATTLVGLLGLYIFERYTLQPELPWLLVFLVSYAAAAIACLIKFGELPAYHLYLSKLGAVLAGLFIVWLYVVDYSRLFLIAVLSVGVLANLESLLATLRLKSFQADIGTVLALRTGERDADG